MISFAKKRSSLILSNFSNTETVFLSFFSFLFFFFLRNTRETDHPGIIQRRVIFASVYHRRAFELHRSRKNHPLVRRSEVFPRFVSPRTYTPSFVPLHPFVRKTICRDHHRDTLISIRIRPIPSLYNNYHDSEARFSKPHNAPRLHSCYV